MSSSTSSSSSGNNMSSYSSADNYLHLLTSVNPTDFICTSERASQIVKLFSEHYLPLPFSSNEDKSDLTEETTLILLVPYFIGLATLQIRQERSPNQPFDMEAHKRIRTIQLKQAKQQFIHFLNLVVQYEQLNDEYLSWVLPFTMHDDDEEELQQVKKKQDEFQKLMSDRNQMILRMKSKTFLENNLFLNCEALSDMEISNLLTEQTDEITNEHKHQVSDKIKKRMLPIREYIQFCVLDTIEQLSSINREEQMLAATSQAQQQLNRPSQQVNSSGSSGISHLKATSINDILSNRSQLSQMGYNMVLLPNASSDKAQKQHKQGNNYLQRTAASNSASQGVASSAFSSYNTQRTIRENMKDKVFGSYVPPPTMSIEEFARQEMEELHQRHEREKLQAQQQTKKKEDDETEEDEEELKKKRAWDDWKDDHVKGSGNMRD
ncbi:hypothetical protein C9374_008962 [Naegleria lovaniensis]|uniref:TAP42-like protein n=1 Tax=Naegleria lovaniensis TaxID=51637 RepID=A0AA88KAH0_NAELO|nr:uncharacterized protein C9374_014322 [Naegleria lovaniensis]XP_044545139.1 uncharacterized protein C9374_008962 [Naegleria lovaniensis]KAG2370691.1 hypothetical protein C9374_014322 [Naegleria lovaniensis]KAG2377877.1 hypothetical protein C9374_008962 [Naegleria lovaniensis]